MAANKQRSKIGWITAFLAMSTILFSTISASVLALDYGSSTYNNACEYGCAGSDQPAQEGVVTANDTDTSVPVSSSKIDLSQFEKFTNGSGYILDVIKGNVLGFTIIVEDPTGSSVDTPSGTQGTSLQSHTITIDSILTDSVTITIASDPKVYTLKLDQQVLVDLTGDNLDDLGVKIMGISPPTASIKVWKITKKVTPVPAASSVSISPDSWYSLAYAAVGATILMILPNSFYAKISGLIYRKNRATSRVGSGHSKKPNYLEKPLTSKKISIIEQEDEGPISVIPVASTAFKEDQNSSNNNDSNIAEGIDQVDSPQDLSNKNNDLG